MAEKEMRMSKYQFVFWGVMYALFGVVIGIALMGAVQQNIPKPVATENYDPLHNDSFFSGAQWECVHEHIADWNFYDEQSYWDRHLSVGDVVNKSGVCFKDVNAADDETYYIPLCDFNAISGEMNCPELPQKDYCTVYKLPVMACDKWQLVKGAN